MNYQIACPCGHLLRGTREPTRQIIACPHCGRKRFVWPRSSWLRRDEIASPPARLRLGRLLAIVSIGGVLAMGVVYLLARPYLRRVTPNEQTFPANVRAHREACEKQLNDGNVHLALREIDRALELSALHPNLADRNELRNPQQLRRQCDLLTRLLDNSLEEIVRQAMQHRDENEWHAKFENHRGRSVIFDDVLRRDVRGRPVLATYAVSIGDREARVALEDLSLLRQMPLDPPRRWLFGAASRLSAEDGGGWVLHFEPESAVLLTDEAAASACCPLPLEDELREVLRRQAEALRQ